MKWPRRQFQHFRFSDNNNVHPVFNYDINLFLRDQKRFNARFFNIFSACYLFPSFFMRGNFTRCTNLRRTEKKSFILHRIYSRLRAAFRDSTFIFSPILIFVRFRKISSSKIKSESSHYDKGIANLRHIVASPAKCKHNSIQIRRYLSIIFCAFSSVACNLEDELSYATIAFSSNFKFQKLPTDTG